MCLPVTPYKVEREWNHLGLSCAVVQAKRGGHRCGYVRVPPAHPMFGKDYNDVEVDAHGGLTFAKIEPCTEHEDGQGWWFGFDCAHAGDAYYDPAHREIMGHSKLGLRTFLEVDTGEHYWTLEEVARECERVAAQIAATA